MDIEDKINYVFRKITKDEFDRLRGLFPDSGQMWLKYRDIRWKEFDNRECPDCRQAPVCRTNFMIMDKITLQHSD